jgi:hypothetical protein
LKLDISQGMTDFQMRLNEYNQMENIAKLAEYYGVPDIPITDFTSVEAFHAYLAQYQPNVSTSGFVIVRNVTRANIDEIWEDPESRWLESRLF